MSGAVASAGRALHKIKVLLEDIETRAGECPEAQRCAKRDPLGSALNLRRIVCFSLRPLPLLRQGVAALAY